MLDPALHTDLTSFCVYMSYLSCAWTLTFDTRRDTMIRLDIFIQQHLDL